MDVARAHQLAWDATHSRISRPARRSCDRASSETCGRSGCTVLLASFAGLALLLAVVGVAGVVGYAVGQRTRELAVRLALGSSPGQAVRYAMRGGLLICTIGILAGLGVALALGRALSGVLYGVGAYDPITFLATAAVLFAAAAFACWLPARRVARISPCLTLRDG